MRRRRQRRLTSPKRERVAHQPDALARASCSYEARAQPESEPLGCARGGRGVLRARSASEWLTSRMHSLALRALMRRVRNPRVSRWDAHAAAEASYEPEARASGSPAGCIRSRFVLL